MIQVKIDNFEGPLDLLIHLIEKNQMKISEINNIAVVSTKITFFYQTCWSAKKKLFLRSKPIMMTVTKPLLLLS